MTLELGKGEAAKNVKALDIKSIDFFIEEMIDRIMDINAALMIAQRKVKNMVEKASAFSEYTYITMNRRLREI